LEWCKNPDRGLPCPDLVLYLEISIEESMRRGDFGNERYEKKAFQENVAKVFDQLKSESNWKVKSIQYAF
jgi:dTMP kinase